MPFDKHGIAHGAAGNRKSHPASGSSELPVNSHQQYCRPPWETIQSLQPRRPTQNRLAIKRYSLKGTRLLLTIPICVWYFRAEQPNGIGQFHIKRLPLIFFRQGIRNTNGSGNKNARSVIGNPFKDESVFKSDIVVASL